MGSAHDLVRVHRFETLDGFIAFDVPESRFNRGGTRLAPDIDEAEMRLLARAMTYKLALLEVKMCGAKIGLRATSENREAVLDAFRREVAPLARLRLVSTGPDLGTTEADFVGLPSPGAAGGIAEIDIAGAPAYAYLTAVAAAAAIEQATAPSGGLEGRGVALEGFGKVGAALARQLAERGARIIAISTVEGSAVAATDDGWSIETLVEARAEHGDSMVSALGVPVRSQEELWTVPADVVVPGARAGVLTSERAERVAARIVAPLANAPYTDRGLEALKARGIEVHADFVVNAGGAMTYLHPEVAHATSASVATEATERATTELVATCLEHRKGPYAGAVARARSFLASWLPGAEDGRLPGPPLAPEEGP